MNYVGFPELIACAIILKCVSDACWNFRDMYVDRQDRKSNVVFRGYGEE